MALLAPAGKGAIITRILQQLSHTQSAVSSLIELKGVTVNFVFRGKLAQPLPIEGAGGSLLDSAESVIIKRCTDCLSTNHNFPLDVSRCGFEELMLRELKNFPAVMTTDQVSVQAPHLYTFFSETYTQVIQDLPEVVELTLVLTTHTNHTVLDSSLAISVGYALGQWLRSFHMWASAPKQTPLNREVWKNEPMRKLKSQISYEAFINVLGNFPGLVEGHEKTLEDVGDLAADEFRKAPEGGEGEAWGVIHGDFWTGNVLMPTKVGAVQESKGTNIFIIDWEFAQFGHRAYDLGQMIGDIYERKHFDNSASAEGTLQGFITGYGPVPDEMAFRTAVHTGIHLICWYTRRAPNSPLPYPLEQVTSLIKLGRDFVVKGWAADRGWLQDSVLAPLFKKD